MFLWSLSILISERPSIGFITAIRMIPRLHRSFLRKLHFRSTEACLQALNYCLIFCQMFFLRTQWVITIEY